MCFADRIGISSGRLLGLFTSLRSAELLWHLTSPYVPAFQHRQYHQCPRHVVLCSYVADSSRALFTQTDTDDEPVIYVWVVVDFGSANPKTMTATGF